MCTEVTFLDYMFATTYCFESPRNIDFTYGKLFCNFFYEKSHWDTKKLICCVSLYLCGAKKFNIWAEILSPIENLYWQWALDSTVLQLVIAVFSSFKIHGITKCFVNALICNKQKCWIIFCTCKRWIQGPYNRDGIFEGGLKSWSTTVMLNTKWRRLKWTGTFRPHGKF